MSVYVTGAAQTTLSIQFQPVLWRCSGLEIENQGSKQLVQVYLENGRVSCGDDATIWNLW